MLNKTNHNFKNKIKYILQQRCTCNACKIYDDVNLNGTSMPVTYIKQSKLEPSLG